MPSLRAGWAYAHPESEAAGITWAELFVLFDLHGNRTAEGQHIKNQAARRRARQRNIDNKHVRPEDERSRKRTMKFASATSMPTLDEELKHFKALCRYITNHDLPEEQRRWFRNEPRANLRRLAPIGIDGHQPGLSAYCQVTEEERTDIRRAIVSQEAAHAG